MADIPFGPPEAPAPQVPLTPGPMPNSPAPTSPTLAPQQAAPAPAPQQQQDAHHALLGRAISGLMGSTPQYSIDPNTGQTVTTRQPNSPGALGKSMVLGALLGLSAASQGDAKGGTLGGFLGGLGRGGTAVAQHGEQQDELRRQQAQQQYQNQLRAQQEQRQQEEAQRQKEAFPLEQQQRQAMIAAENAQTLRTQQLIKGESFALFRQQAEFGQHATEAYRQAGISPIAEAKTPDELQTILAANAKASAWDWEQTGVKVVMKRDKDGNEVADYVPTFDAYDPTRSVKLNKSFLDDLKKNGVDEVYPGTTSQLREGQELTPQQFMTLKNLGSTAYNQKIERQKNTLTLEEGKLKLEETRANIEKLRAEAAKRGKAEKQAALLDDGLTAWNSELDSELKSNPNATHLDAFKALKPKQQFEIVNGFNNQAKELDTSIKNALSQVPPDTATAEASMVQLDGIRQMQKMTVGAGTPQTPAAQVTAPRKPDKLGDALSTDMAAGYMQAAGGDPNKARQMAIDDGWQVPGAPKPTRYGQAVKERNQKIGETVQRGAQILGQIPIVP